MDIEQRVLTRPKHGYKGLLVNRFQEPTTACAVQLEIGQVTR